MALSDREVLNKICELAVSRRERCPLREILKECRLKIQGKIEECKANLTNQKHAAVALTVELGFCKATVGSSNLSGGLTVMGPDQKDTSNWVVPS